MKTDNPSITTSIFSPVKLAKSWAPTPNAPPNNVAIALFTPFPKVAPASLYIFISTCISI